MTKENDICDQINTDIQLLLTFDYSEDHNNMNKIKLIDNKDVKK